MDKIHKLVAFCILMENKEGILSKAPQYIDEKFLACMKMEDPSVILDRVNKAKYDLWVNTWDRR